MENSFIAENLHRVLEQIDEAVKFSGRKSGEVKLCAVSKFHPQEALLEAMRAGQVLFGENRVQEAYSKFQLDDDVLKGLFVPELHIIGALQTNKVKKACEIASCIQSVDRLSLLAEIEKQCSKLEKNISVFMEFHTGEDSKSGYENQDLLYESLEQVSLGKFPHINVSGLMTMAPFTDDELRVRKSFETLRNLRDDIAIRFPQLNIRELSMGMSGDYRIAIEEGSTMVRVGTAIFGQRNYNA